jgi:hypothetical protein
MSILSCGSSINASYLVSVNLAMRFQSRNFFLKLVNQKQLLPVQALFVDGLGRNRTSLQRTFQGCFLQSSGSFGQTVSEENFVLEINQSAARIACGGHV